MAVSRNVQFFLALTPENDQGNRPPYDPTPALARIRALPWRQRYDGEDERILRLWPRARTPGGMLGSIRRTALPPVDRGEEIGDLDLGPEEGIIEETFFTIFDQRYVGVVRNRYGPSIARLADYLDNMCATEHQDVEFLPLARADTIEQLAHIQNLRVLILKVHPSAVALVQQSEPDLYEVFEGSRRLADDDAEYLEVNLSVGRRGRGASLGRRLTRLTQRLARRDDLGDIATKFQVTFEDHEDERLAVNVLDDRLISKQEIQTTAERAGRLDERSAYTAIRAAYSDLRDDLAQAAAIEQTDT